ncbi:MAG: hypothetical protein QM640_10635 [Niabella sp.]
MKRRQNVMIGLIAAVVTLGGLYAFAGEKYFGKQYDRCHWQKHRNTSNEEWYKDSERPFVQKDSINIH